MTSGAIVTPGACPSRLGVRLGYAEGVRLGCVCLCLTGDRGPCQNAGEGRPRLRAARAEDFVQRDSSVAGATVHANRANGLARPPSNGIGPLVDHNELALLSDANGPLTLSRCRVGGLSL